MLLSCSEQTVPEGKVRLLGLWEMHDMLISFQVISTFERLPMEIHILILMGTPDLTVQVNSSFMQKVLRSIS